MPQAHRAVAAHLRALAWRRRTWGWGPNHPSNKAGRRLDELAQFVESLSALDERLLMLESLAVREDEFRPGPKATLEIEQYGWHGSLEPDQFLYTLAVAVRDDALLRARECGVLPPLE